MHMADALLSPVVGGAMWTASAGIMAHSGSKLKNGIDESKIPLMGVMGAFVFAAQMINFTIPMTGSSGHIGGGILLSILLGPYAAFITLASVLVIQALFFADGGLLALGANIFNMGFFACFVVYPFIFKPMIKKGVTDRSIFKASMVSAIISLQMGALFVVLQTLFSGKTELPFTAFLLLMQPIHLAIGIGEGLATAATAIFILKARPQLISSSDLEHSVSSFSLKKTMGILLAASLMIGAGLSLFASSNPDGLEWSIGKIMASSEIEVEGTLYEKADKIQQSTSILPDYSFKDAAEGSAAGTSFSGLAGSLTTLVIASLTGMTIRKFKKKQYMKKPSL